MFLKISNVFNDESYADYKGLDLKKIKAGTQIYPEGANEAYFYYTAEPIEHSDVQVITVEEYETILAEHTAKQESVVTPEKEIEKLKIENEILNQALLETSAYVVMQEERLTTQEQALLELTTLVLGGEA